MYPLRPHCWINVVAQDKFTAIHRRMMQIGPFLGESESSVYALCVPAVETVLLDPELSSQRRFLIYIWLHGFGRRRVGTLRRGKTCGAGQVAP